MIKKDLNHIRRVFIVTQYIVFLVAFILCSFLVTKNYLRVTEKLNLDHIDRLSYLLTSQIKASKNMPVFSARKDMIVFVIDKATGAYIFPREGWIDPDPKIWKSYETKLIYEMQKQGAGWISYPDKSSPGYKQGRLIRYHPIPEHGWIVATEVLLDNNINTLFEVFTWRFYMPIVLILVLAFWAIYASTNRNYYLVKRTLADIFENNLMNMNSDILWPKPSIQTALKTEPQTVQPDKKKTSIIFQASQQTGNTKTAPFPEPIKATPVQEPENDQPEQSEIDNTTETPQLTTQQKRAHSDTEYDEMKIAIDNINSPILKKMIQELRER